MKSSHFDKWSSVAIVVIAAAELNPKSLEVNLEDLVKKNIVTQLFGGMGSLCLCEVQPGTASLGVSKIKLVKLQ